MQWDELTSNLANISSYYIDIEVWRSYVSHCLALNYQ